MKTRLFFALLSGIIFCPAIFSQQITETIFGDSGWNAPYKLWQMPDGNIAVVSGSSPSKTKLFHLDLAGNVTAGYDLPAPTASNFVQPSTDGATFHYGRIGVAGYTIHLINLAGQTLDSIVFLPGEPVWDDYSFAIRPAPGGHFVLAYKAYNDQTSSFTVRIVRLDAQGNVVFNKTFNSDSPDFYNTCLETLPDGRTVVLVHNFDQASRMICLGPSGTTLWNKSLPYQIILLEESALAPLDDGTIALYGRYGYDGANLVDGYVIRYTVSGNVAYSHTFEDDLPGFRPYQTFSDGNQLVIAGDYSQPDEHGLGVLKLNAVGQKVFAKKFNLLSGYDGSKAVLTANGEYIFSGNRFKSVPQGFQTEKGYVLCLQPDGTFNWFDSTQVAHINRINDIRHLGNGDLLLAGDAYNLPLPATGSSNLLLRVSGIGPLYSYLVEGNILTDSNDNCEPDPGEPPLSGWILKAETPNGNRYATSDAAGNYNIRLNANSANISVSKPNDLWQSCQTAYPVLFTGSDTTSLNIPVLQIAQCPFLSLDGAAAILRRCFDNTYNFYWCNTGTTVAENTVLTLTLDAYTDYVSSSLPLAGQNGQELSFQVGNLSPGQCGDLTLTIHLTCEAELGQMHCLEAKLVAAETCPAQTYHTVSDRDCQANIGSFDPNDKRAFVRDTLREGYILPNSEIEYQIRFQNTGTDTAFNIVVVDTIANTLDINTLHPGVSSHPCTFQLHGGNVAKFVFNNIQLPDSNINEAASHGFVNFNIAQKPDLPLLTEIKNKVDIYFDYNSPVATNWHKLVVNTTTTSSTPSDALAFVEAYPNPANNGQCWIISRDPARLLQQVQVFDSTGRLTFGVQPARNKMHLELPDAKGVYFVKIILDDGRWGVVRMIR